MKGCKLLLAFCQDTGIPQSIIAERLKEHHLNLDDLLQRAEIVQQGITECASDDGWSLIRDDDLKLLYRHEHGSTVHCFKAYCELPAPVVVSHHACSLCTWTDTWSTSHSCCSVGTFMPAIGACDQVSVIDAADITALYVYSTHYYQTAMSMLPVTYLHKAHLSCTMLDMPLLCLQEPLAMAREFDLVTAWNNYIKASDILQVWLLGPCRQGCCVL